MSETYPTEWADDNSNPNRKSVSDWAQENQIEAWLLPLESRKDNPVELVAAYVDHIDSMAKTQATFTSKEVGTQFHSGYATPMKSLLLLRKVATTHRRGRYVNPNYCHLGHHEPAIKDDTERLAFYNRFKYSPCLSVEWLATNFGIKDRGVSDFFTRHNIDLATQIQANRERFGRTLWTIWTWTDYSKRELGEKLPVPWETAATWMDRYGRDAADWEPPERPKREPWYNRDRAVIS